MKNKEIENIIQNFKYKNGIYFYPKELEFKNTDSNIMNAAHLLNESLNQNIIEPSDFLEKFRKNMDNYFLVKNPDLKDEYYNLLNTNKSNGKKLKWNILFCEPNHIFSLHIHPNIEYEYSPSLKYSLGEYRYKTQVNKNTNIKDLTKKDFAFKKNKVIINPVNSMHVSYSTNNYSISLILWSGEHIKFTPQKSPKFLKKVTF